ncbi:DUF177 domain-containing protein [Aestuariivita sp.]|jgi:uncharacterized metal-binding protein YceD (DUF177 family)|uniref:YceD family protein n=1 Tax=Aestuariivita sp. TaxID=1872407 RepID=UPI00216EACBF|nr:DUF177 domain-containing protein [Aestuariivita sp.]MCE8009280.1 DUF177 domain-containing protein [Aestuariivita sp.]
MSAQSSAFDPKRPIYRLSDLPQGKPTRFDLSPDAQDMRALAEELELNALRKLRFAGEIRATGETDWRIDARLGATVVQPCVVSLEPVTTRIETSVTRHYVADHVEPDAAEVEMPEDDTVEPLPHQIDLTAVMAEALALSIPAYPRKDSAETVQAVFTEPGKAPLTDDDVRPFAGLAELRDKLEGKE